MTRWRVRRRTVVRVLVGVVAVLVAGVAALAWFYPSVTATTCPRCYGLERVQDHLYAEAGLSATRRRDLADLVRYAHRRIAGFYGSRGSDPDVLACVTEDCYARIGGGRERGVAVLNRAVMLSPRGIDKVIATHELAHVELHHRLESQDAVPQWFDEGLAVLVADDPRYLRPESSSDRCRVAPGGPLPVTLTEWLSAASADRQLYARAACRVSRWLDASGGRKAVLDLVDRLNRGEPLPAALHR